jgi:hypothetical protein
MQILPCVLQQNVEVLTSVYRRKRCNGNLCYTTSKRCSWDSKYYCVTHSSSNHIAYSFITRFKLISKYLILWCALMCSEDYCRTGCVVSTMPGYLMTENYDCVLCIIYSQRNIQFLPLIWLLNMRRDKERHCHWIPDRSCCLSGEWVQSWFPWIWEG